MASRLRKALSAAMVLFIAAPAVPADTLITQCNDANLRAAVAAGGVITFGCDGVIELTNTIILTADVEIDGTGRSISISGGGMHQLFAMTNRSFTLRNIALVNGQAKGLDARPDPRFPVDPNSPFPMEEVYLPADPGRGGAVTADGGALIIDGCRIEGNRALGGAGYVFQAAGALSEGGAILMRGGVLTITNSSFIDNGSLSGGGFLVDAPRGEAFGGAIALIDTFAEVSDTRFVENWVQTGEAGIVSAARPAKGGAIYIKGGSATLTRTIFERNNCFERGAIRTRGAIGAGGAIYSEAELSLSECTFSENRARGGIGRILSNENPEPAGDGIGGAIASYSELEVTDSAFISNSAIGGNASTDSLTGFWGAGAQARGGALAAFGPTTISNSTFASNVAAEPQLKNESSGRAMGGAIYLDTSDAQLNYLTISHGQLIRNPDSTAATEGAGIYATVSSSVALQGVLLNDNFVRTRSRIVYPPGEAPLDNTYLPSNIAGTVQDAGFNLSSDDTGLTHESSLKNTDPILGPLGNYGERTATFPLLSGSPAIDAGGTAGIPAQDQRGRSRPFGTAADIGAYESSAPFFVAGMVSGAPGEAFVIGATSLSTQTDSGGAYVLSGFPAGADQITPESDSFVFEPSTLPVQMDADVVGADFRAFRIGTITWEFAGAEGSSVVFVAANAGEYAIQSSDDLESWGTMDTETLAANQIHRVEVIPSEGAMFFRARLVE